MKTESRWITLARHGPVAVHWQSRISGSGFAEFVEELQASGIVPGSEPTTATRELAREAGILVCSDQQRSVESGKVIAPTRPFLCESLFREAEVPTKFRTSLSFRANTWVVLARMLWYVRRWSGIESPSEARKRARQATSLLERLIEQEGSVFLVGHGYFNALVASELCRRGCRGPKFPSTQHWGATTYRQAG